MDTISIKLEANLTKQIAKALHDFNYSTKTEFIRDAIRTKLTELDKKRREEKAWQALFAARGILKGKVKEMTDEEWIAWRRKAGEKVFEKLKKKHGLT